MIRLIPLALAALLTLPQTLAAQSRPEPPKTVAEGLERLQSPRRESYRAPPGNIRAEDYRAALGNTVMITGISMKARVADPLYNMKIIFIGRDGRYIWCSEDKTGTRYTNHHEWRAIKRKLRGRLTPLFDPSAKPSHKGVNSPLYDGATGQIIWYTLWKGRWWDWDTGHLQERLPAATWTLCPDFPSAEELGVGINRRQTATNYPALLAQDPGRRILRPEFVTPNPVEPIR